MTYRVRDLKTGQWLVFAGSTGVTWRGEKSQARIYPTREAAEAAAKKARWLDYEPVVVETET